MYHELPIWGGGCSQQFEEDMLIMKRHYLIENVSSKKKLNVSIHHMNYVDTQLTATE